MATATSIASRRSALTSAADPATAFSRLSSESLLNLLATRSIRSSSSSSSSDAATSAELSDTTSSAIVPRARVLNTRWVPAWSHACDINSIRW